jgi:hypothetical protein
VQPTIPETVADVCSDNDEPWDTTQLTELSEDQTVVKHMVNPIVIDGVKSTVPKFFPVTLTMVPALVAPLRGCTS